MTRFLLYLAISFALPAAARADVIEIADDGSFAVYDAPAVFTTEGAQPIVVATPVAPTIMASTPDEVRAAITAAADRFSVSRDLIEAVAWRESRFRQNAVSSAGAVGVMQLMPAAAREVGVDRFDLQQNVHGGTAYLSRMMNRFGGDVRLALAAYNAGPGAVEKHRGVPPYAETQAYVAAILGRLSQQALVVSPTLALGR